MTTAIYRQPYSLPRRCHRTPQDDQGLVQFIQDDIDRPIVTGSVVNGTHRPVTHSHAGSLPGNKALSGIKSKMYKGSGANEIVWDDSTSEQRIRVATDHAATALNLGYLVHPRVNGKGEPRGQGLELRTDRSRSPDMGTQC